MIYLELGNAKPDLTLIGKVSEKLKINICFGNSEEMLLLLRYLYICEHFRVRINESTRTLFHQRSRTSFSVTGQRDSHDCELLLQRST